MYFTTQCFFWRKQITTKTKDLKQSTKTSANKNQFLMFSLNLLQKTNTFYFYNPNDIDKKSLSEITERLFYIIKIRIKL